MKQGNIVCDTESYVAASLKMVPRFIIVLVNEFKKIEHSLKSFKYKVLKIQKHKQSWGITAMYVRKT